MGTKSMMSHEKTTVAVVEFPTHSLGEGVGGVDDPIYMN